MPHVSRMLREMVEAIEALTADHSLVLWLEGLHWADYSTVDWLTAIAQQRGPARLLVIGTYRPAEVSIIRFLYDNYPFTDCVAVRR